MTLQGPELPGPEHIVDGFDCGKAPLNSWLLRRALANQRSGASRTWVVSDEASRRVVAYYASATASILRSAATTRAARNQPEDVPAVLLARLAVDTDFAGPGLGATLLKHFVLTALEVAAVVGARILLVHAQDSDARQFYLHHDFEPSPIDELTLMRVLADLA
ncbi:MAG: GNAT family N-acetyltransferase [Mycobacteriales bacterium]